MDKSKKLILSITIGLIVILTVIFLFHENIINIKNVKVSDVIGKNVSLYFFDKLFSISAQVQRYFEIEQKKIDYTEKQFSKSLNNRNNYNFKLLTDFVSKSKDCQKIRIYDESFVLKWSSDKNDVIDNSMDTSQKNLLLPLLIGKDNKFIYNQYSGLIYPIDENIRGNNLFIIFYYEPKDIFKSIKIMANTDIKTINIVGNSLILINFSEKDINDSKNISILEGELKDKDKGVIRVTSKDFDEVIYYKALSGTMMDWKVALSVESKSLQISGGGYFILVLQSLVFLALLIFIITNLKEKTKAIQKKIKVQKEEAIEKLGEEPEEAEEVRKNIPEMAKESAKEIEKLKGVSKTEEAEPLQELSSEEKEKTGEEIYEEAEEVLPVEEVEEVEYVEEIGEAEVAEDIEEAEEVGDIEEAEQEGQTEETGEIERALSLEESEEPKKRSSKKAEGTETVKENHSEINNITEEKDLGISEEIERDTLSFEENKIPQLKDLIEPGTENKGSEEIEEIPSISEELFEEKMKNEPKDELSKLIEEIEEESNLNEKKISDIKSYFIEVLNRLKLPKGAILLKKGEFYFPLISINLNSETEGKLRFLAKEKIVTNFFTKSKVLYIKDNVFESNDIGTKFSDKDKEGVNGLLFYPMKKEGEVIAIALILIKDKSFNYKEGLEELKGLKKLF